MIKNIVPSAFRDRYRSAYLKANLGLKVIWGKLTRMVHRPTLPKCENGSVKLHLGCGSVSHPGYVNIDLYPHPHIHYVHSIDRLPMFRDNTVDLIYACHCLEHFPHGTVPAVLSEWHRVLKRDGVLRLSVPDFDLLLEMYARTGKEVGKNMEVMNMALMGGQDSPLNFHRSVFNMESLARLLTQVGFRVTRRWTPEALGSDSFDDWSQKALSVEGMKYPFSLNVEAIK